MCVRVCSEACLRACVRACVRMFDLFGLFWIKANSHLHVHCMNVEAKDLHSQPPHRRSTPPRPQHFQQPCHHPSPAVLDSRSVALSGACWDSEIPCLISFSEDAIFHRRILACPLAVHATLSVQQGALLFPIRLCPGEAAFRLARGLESPLQMRTTSTIEWCEDISCQVNHIYLKSKFDSRG